MYLCPEDRDETARAFVMERLPTQERTLFAAHLKTRAGCSQSVQSAEDFIAAIREAALSLDEENADNPSP
jgi:hypothetical protein